MHPDYFITSARLGFRCWSREDLPLAVELWGDPKVTALIGGPLTEETASARLEQEISQQRTRGLQYWPIFLLDSGQHVGCAGLRSYRSEPRVYELGFHVRPSFWNQGLATEAADVVIRYAFTTLGAQALFAGHHPANHASRRVLLKLGFCRTHDELYPPTGLLHPSYRLEKNTA